MIIHKQILETGEIYLAGIKKTMSLAENKTQELWETFMPRRQEIKNAINNNLYSVEVCPQGYFDSFSVHTPFEKWAAIAVTDFNDVPDWGACLTIPAGKHLVLTYKGKPQDLHKYYADILNKTIPESGHLLDHRPHLAVMGALYKGNAHDSQEELWFPII